MALKATLEQWDQAVQAYDQQDFNTALDLFETIADSAKIHFNIGVILAAAGDHESAVKSYHAALYLDQYFALAYFQKGVSNAKLGEWEVAFDDFNDALLYLRGNLFIDYKQLGLDYKLYSCEVLFNRGVCYMKLNDEELGIQDFETARKEKQLPDHARVDLALTQGWDNQPIFKMPRGKLFRPDESKLKNSKKVDYLGKAKLIATHNDSDTNTGFKGSADRQVIRDNVTMPIPRSNVVHLTSVSSSRFGGPPPLMRNNTYAGIGSRQAINETGVERRPTADVILPVLRSRSPSAALSPTMRTMQDGSPLMRRHTESSASPPHSALLSPKKSYEAMLTGGSDDERQSPLSDPTASGSAAKLSRTNSRARALELARQNTMDRRGVQQRAENGYAPSGRSEPGQRKSPPNSNNDGQYNVTTTAVPLGKIKLKCHYHDHTRYLLVDSDVDYDELRMRVTDKFKGRKLLQLKYRDEDNELVLVLDNEDLDIARGNFGRAEGMATRMELWCFD